MNNITYKQQKNGQAVYLDGKRVGTIWRVATGWSYFPKGQKKGGETFPSLAKVKASIEAP